DQKYNFNNQEFWEAIFGESSSQQKGDGCPITDFYKIGEQYHLRVQKRKSSAKNFQIQREAHCLLRVPCRHPHPLHLKFRDIFLEEKGVDPFFTSLTIASACNHIYREKYLLEDTIGLIPHGGYSRAENQSVIGIKWLKYTAETRKIKIRHKLNGGEVKIGPYKVDGIHNREIFELYGCQQGEKKQLAKFFAKAEIPEPLGPQEAFYGGRMNAIKLYHNCEVGKKIKYDV
uniref:Uncharacterized protein n=1 Tax=Romanomermis culicivorax TaxID=13658 RepID=A0A915IL67_ROMCU